jgi:hypothetical protein
MRARGLIVKRVPAGSRGSRVLGRCLARRGVGRARSCAHTRGSVARTPRPGRRPRGPLRWPSPAWAASRVVHEVHVDREARHHPVAPPVSVPGRCSWLIMVAPAFLSSPSLQSLGPSTRRQSASSGVQATPDIRADDFGYRQPGGECHGVDGDQLGGDDRRPAVRKRSIPDDVREVGLRGPQPGRSGRREVYPPVAVPLEPLHARDSCLACLPS